MARAFVGRHGSIQLSVGEFEVALIRQAAKLVRRIGLDSADAELARLQPAIYPEDADASAEFSRLMAPEVDRARTEDVERVDAALESGGSPKTLTVDQAEAMVRVLGEARLVVAARNGVRLGDQELDPIRFKPASWAMMYTTTQVQEELSMALIDRLEEDW